MGSLRLLVLTFLALVSGLRTAKADNCPYTGPPIGLPPPPSKNVSEIEFYLWTPENKHNDTYEKLIFKDGNSVDSSSFNAARNTKVIAHGFTRCGYDEWILEAKDEFLKLGMYLIRVLRKLVCNIENCVGRGPQHNFHRMERVGRSWTTLFPGVRQLLSNRRICSRVPRLAHDVHRRRRHVFSSYWFQFGCPSRRKHRLQFANQVWKNA